MVREKLKVCPWLASAWQKSMHLETKEELTSVTAAIFGLLLNYENVGIAEKHAASHSIPRFSDGIEWSNSLLKLYNGLLEW